MRSGLLRHSMQFIVSDAEPDAYGQQAVSDNLQSPTYKCSIKVRTFRERKENDQLASRVEYEITTRFNETVADTNPKAKLRVYIESGIKDLEVLAIVDPNGKRKVLTVYAEEIK